MDAFQGLKSIELNFSDRELSIIEKGAAKLNMTVEQFTQYAVKESLARKFKRSNKSAQVFQIRKAPRD